MLDKIVPSQKANMQVYQPLSKSGWSSLMDRLPTLLAGKSSVTRANNHNRIALIRLATRHAPAMATYAAAAGLTFFYFIDWQRVSKNIPFYGKTFREDHRGFKWDSSEILEERRRFNKYSPTLNLKWWMEKAPCYLLFLATFVYRIKYFIE